MATMVRWSSKCGPICEATDEARATVATHQASSLRRARFRVTCSRARPANSMTRRLPSGTSSGTQRARVTMAAARRGHMAVKMLKTPIIPMMKGTIPWRSFTLSSRTRAWRCTRRAPITAATQRTTARSTQMPTCWMSFGCFSMAAPL
ncbi:MAG: hypothetical protein DMF77_18350 [Acidobacteria bacterium]|nr:MAG: hypothetical protein DMF77_18350 [Acidobacteriota bacterium]